MVWKQWKYFRKNQTKTTKFGSQDQTSVSEKFHDKFLTTKDLEHDRQTRPTAFNSFSRLGNPFKQATKRSESQTNNLPFQSSFN
jgi:hypothetical protein